MLIIISFQNASSVPCSIQNSQRPHQNPRRPDDESLVDLLGFVLRREQSRPPLSLQLLLTPLLFFRPTHPNRPPHPPHDPFPAREWRHARATTAHTALPGLRVPSTRKRLRARLPNSMGRRCWRKVVVARGPVGSCYSRRLVMSRRCLTRTTSLGSCRSSPRSGLSLLLLVSLESANEGVQSGLNDQPSYDQTSLSAFWSIDLIRSPKSLYVPNPPPVKVGARF